MIEDPNKETQTAMAAAQSLIDYLRRVGSIEAEWALADETGVWAISVQHKSHAADGERS